MLLNGHHRWMAAYRFELKKTKVEIVNVTHEEDIRKAMEKTSNVKCASFDFDEVVLANRGNALT